MSKDCFICGPGESAPAQSNNKVVQQPEVIVTEAPAAVSRSISVVDATIIYVLGKIDGTGPPQVNIYSEINGWHIRSIPAARWQNPVLIGAGFGHLVVVDRFPDYDVLRITDEYGGAGAGSYDSFGFPLPGVNFSSFNDIRQIQVPTGMRVTGLKVMPDGCLIAGLSSGDNSFRFLKALVDEQFNATSPYEGVLQVTPSPFDFAGNPTGTFASFDPKPGPRQHQVFGVANGSNGGSVLLFDYILGKVVGHFGLPVGYTAVSVAQSGEILTVLLQGPSGPTVLRAAVAQSTYFMAGNRSDKTVQGPQNYVVDQTFVPQDIPSLAGAATTDKLNDYLKAAGSINTGTNNEQLVITDPVAADVFATISPATDSITAGGGRVAQSGTDTTAWGGYTTGTTPIPVVLITPDTGNQIPVYLESTADSMTELLQVPGGDANAISNATVFRVLHGSHYDWVSAGGYVYGCNNGSNFVGKTDRLVGTCIATDRVAELGKLKDLPDVKAVLYDAATGLRIYRHPKPLGFTIFGGNYADLAYTSNTNVTESTCGTTVDGEASIFDGIDRTNNFYPVLETPEGPHTDAVPVPAWNTPTDLNAPWQLFTRRAVVSSTQIKVVPKLSNWTYRSPTFGDILPWWRNLTNPCVTQSVSTLFYPVIGGVYAADNDPNGIHRPVLIAHSIAGFFNLGLPMIQTTTCQQMIEDVNNKNDQLAFLQSQLAGTHNQAEIDALNAQISALQALIASENAQISTCDPSNPDNIVFAIPNYIKNLSLPIDTPTNTQTIDPILGGTDENPDVIAPTTPWQSITLPGDTAPEKRGVVIDPGIRSWIAVEVKLNRDNRGGFSGDGQDVWAQPETKKGLLGLNVGPASANDILHMTGTGDLYPFCGGEVPANLYDSGDVASGGAGGFWEVEITGNGSSLDSIGNLVTFNEQITALAPTDMQDSLTSVFTLHRDGGGVDPEVGLHFGKVYFSNQTINQVTIKVRLVNYAFDVYRFGTRTLSYVITQDPTTGRIPGNPGDFNARIIGFRPNIVTSDIVNGQLIPTFIYGCDPGYDWGNQCSAFCFGNLTCGSAVFQGSKLCQSDPTDAVVRNIIGEWVATYEIPTSNNPYNAQGLAIGNYINAYMEMQFNAGCFNYDVVLRSGDGRTQHAGGCA